MSSQTQRRGFAVLWAMMLIFVITTLAVAVAPGLTQIADRNRVEKTASLLRDIGVGMNLMEQKVARKFPGRPSQLTIPITASSIMSCWGSTYGAPDVNTWGANAPFVDFYIPDTGLWTPIGALSDSILDRTSNHRDSLWLVIPGVSAEDAALLKAFVDTNSNPNIDTVRYHAPVGGTTTVLWRVTQRETNRC